MKYNGSSWVLVGTRGFSGGAAYNTSMAMDSSGMPYVAFEDVSNGYKAKVMKFAGSDWVYVGSPDFSVDTVMDIAIAIDIGGTPYVVFVDYSNNLKATVMKYNGSSWVNVGSPGFSLGGVGGTSIAIDKSGTPYVVFCDGETTVMKYNGSDWGYVGSPDFSMLLAGAFGINAAGITIDMNGIPYVVYTAQDEFYFDTFYLTVMKYGTNTGVSNINDPDAVLAIYPNPNTGSFTVRISSSANEDATVVITDILGEKVKEINTITNTTAQIQIDNPPGMYFISAASAHGTQSAKVVVW